MKTRFPRSTVRFGFSKNAQRLLKVSFHFHLWHRSIGFLLSNPCNQIQLKKIINKLPFKNRICNIALHNKEEKKKKLEMHQWASMVKHVAKFTNSDSLTIHSRSITTLTRSIAMAHEREIFGKEPKQTRTRSFYMTLSKCFNDRWQKREKFDLNSRFYCVLNCDWRQNTAFKRCNTLGRFDFCFASGRISSNFHDILIRANAFQNQQSISFPKELKIREASGTLLPAINFCFPFISVNIFVGPLSGMRYRRISIIFGIIFNGCFYVFLRRFLRRF